MEYLASDKIAVIDLASGEVEEQELSDELVQEKIGGAGITLALYEQYKDSDPLVLGTGLFTGTLVPGSSLGVITGKSPLTGTVVHSPFTQYAGMELKYSGFDYIVIKGQAAEPSYLWIHDGIADLNPAGPLWGMDVWEAVKTVRHEMGDEMIQVLGAGPAAQKGSDLGQLMINQWASGDRFGMGRALAAKNLVLVALRGMGLLEIAEPDDFVEKCQELLGAVKGGAWAGKKGIADLGAALGFDDFPAWIGEVVHRSRGSFNTPFAYNTYAMIEGAVDGKEEESIEEPGVMIGDPAAAGELKRLGLAAKDAAGLIRQCAKLGLDVVAVAKVCEAKGVTDAAGIAGALDGISGPVDGLAGPFSPWAPEGLAGDEAAWKRRQAVAYLFGLDPIYVLMAPELSEEALLALVPVGTELEVDAEALDKVIGEISA